MLFTSFVFLILVIGTFLFYYMPFLRKYQIHILIIASLIFYAWHNPVLLLLLLFSVFINILTTYFIVVKTIKFKKTISILGVVVNLLVLGFFKYSGLFAKAFSIDGDLGDILISIPLPIGISFFTFQGISLVVDVFKENHFKNYEVIPQNFFDLSKRILFFIAFFPQLIAGPIVKAYEFLPQITVKKIQNVNWKNVFRTLILGYFLKMFVADNLKDFTFWMDYPYFMYYKSIDLIVMLFGYSFQIFADFAGYSLIAIGLAELFGYNLKKNFNFPYIASSFKDFWKRWHISLSSFLMEYLYIPLGGNRKGKWRTYFNLLITMCLGGLWHGAAWSYAIWGGFHGVLLAIEKFFNNTINIKSTKFFSVFYGSFVFVMISFAWLLFKLPNFNDVIEYLKHIINIKSLSFSKNVFLHIFLYSIPIILYHIAYIKKNFFIRFESFFYAVMLFLIFTNSGSSKAFIYFQF